MVYYDGECIYEEDDYAGLVGQFADATGGQWRPENLRSTWMAVEGLAVCWWTAVEFDHADRGFRWEIESACSDWVSGDFELCVCEFAEQNLPGRFVWLPTGDQHAYYRYLPS